MRNLLLIFSFLMIAIEGFAEVSISTFPVSHQIRPDRDLVDTQFKLPPNSDYEIIVRTPKSNLFISTDFPMVEDTQLYHLKGYSESGQVSFKTIYPIRGVYDFSIKLNGEWQQLQLEINETPNEIKNMIVFLGVLAVIGVLGGFFLRKITVTAVALLLMLNLTPDLQAHTGEHEIGKKGNLIWETKEEGYHFSVRFDSSRAIVGQSVLFNIQLVNENKILPDPFTVKIQTFHMEDETVMFEGSFTSSETTPQSCGFCELGETMQFFDGAETKVTFTATLSNGKTLELDGVIAVEGISPPLSSKIKALTLIMLLVLVGIGIGFFLIPGKKQVVKHAI